MTSIQCQPDEHSDVRVSHGSIEEFITKATCLVIHLQFFKLCKKIIKIGKTVAYNSISRCIYLLACLSLLISDSVGRLSIFLLQEGNLRRIPVRNSVKKEKVTIALLVFGRGMTPAANDERRVIGITALEYRNIPSVFWIS